MSTINQGGGGREGMLAWSGGVSFLSSMRLDRGEFGMVLRLDKECIFAVRSHCCMVLKCPL